MGAVNKSQIICSYCGQVVYNKREELTNSQLPHASYLIEPLYDTDEECMTALVAELVCADYVPTDIFDTFTIEAVRHNMYPIYVFDVNWSANWSALFSQQVSHEEPSYDYSGKRTGATKLVYETQYRDANGTSAGDCRVILPGLMQGFPNQTEICGSYFELDGKDGRILDLIKRGQEFAAVKLYSEINGVGFLEAEEKIDELRNSWPKVEKSKSSAIEPKSITEIEIEKLNRWELIDPDIDDKKAWQKGGEDILVEHVDVGVMNDIWSMSNGWTVENKNYTYRYSNNNNRCVLVPIWEADFRYGEILYSASAATHIGGKVFLEQYPKDEKEVAFSDEQEDKITEYETRRAWGYSFFGVFAAVCISFLILIADKFSGERFSLFLVSFVFSVVAWVLARMFQRKKLYFDYALENRLWFTKSKRQEQAEKKLGIHVSIEDKPEEKKAETAIDIIVYFLLLTLLTTGLVIASQNGLFQIKYNPPKPHTSQQSNNKNTNTHASSSGYNTESNHHSETSMRRDKRQQLNSTSPTQTELPVSENTISQPQSIIEQTQEQPTAPIASILDLGYATYEPMEGASGIKDGKPHGNGIMRFKSRQTIPGTVDCVAEPGEWVNGMWRDGKVNAGTWYRNDGNQIIVKLGQRYNK